MVNMVQDNYPETFVQKTAPLLVSLGVQPPTYAKKQLYTILHKRLGRHKLEETKSELTTSMHGIPTSAHFSSAFTHLGEGGFGSVWRAVRRETGEEVALKIIKKRQHHNKILASDEIEVMQKLKHPNILQLEDW